MRQKDSVKLFVTYATSATKEGRNPRLTSGQVYEATSIRIYFNFRPDVRIINDDGDEEWVELGEDIFEVRDPEEYLR